MKDRILQFLKSENKSSSQFAEEIGVQPSGISHILSGRNNPSLDFILKMLERYKYLSADWLLFGKGQMYKSTSGMPTLFDQENTVEPEAASFDRNKDAQSKSPEVSGIPEETKTLIPDNTAAVDRIIVFYADKSFEVYYPRK